MGAETYSVAFVALVHLCNLKTFIKDFCCVKRAPPGMWEGR
ncbi:MAG: hypothetical protein ACTSXJ_10125 [Candidatus Baldrarchaeia archaeon]